MPRKKGFSGRKKLTAETQRNLILKQKRAFWNKSRRPGALIEKKLAEINPKGKLVLTVKGEQKLKKMKEEQARRREEILLKEIIPQEGVTQISQKLLEKLKHSESYEAHGEYSASQGFLTARMQVLISGRIGFVIHSDTPDVIYRVIADNPQDLIRTHAFDAKTGKLIEKIK